jgi:hypothetical protein
MSAANFRYCRTVLARRWTVTCDHVPGAPVHRPWDERGAWAGIDAILASAV